MVRQIDVRSAEDRTDRGRTAGLQEAAAEVSDRVLPGDHRVRVVSVDAATGNAAVVVSEAAPPAQGDYVMRALRHLHRIGPALGLAPEQAAEFVPDPEEQVTSTGAVAVHLVQQYKGVPIYEAGQTVRFDDAGRVLETAGMSVTVPADVPLAPALSPEEALRRAAEHVAEGGQDADAPDADPFGQPLLEPVLDLGDFRPVLRTSGADRPASPAVFDAPPFEHAVTVSLLWFPVDGGLRLAWHTKLAVPGGAVYRVVVDAGDGRLLLVRRLTRGIVGRAHVVLAAGGVPTPTVLPRPLGEHGPPVPEGLPAGFPDDWLLGASTAGWSVQAVLEPGAVPVRGRVEGGEVVFGPAPAAGHPDQLVVNLFALCSGMHDLLYLLGFREADGNFQADNRGRGGRGADPVVARVHPGVVWGTANMGTPPDGRRPTMNMGLVQSTGRHTALDPDVVYHEYVHGLTNRLVGGPLNDTALDAVQAGGMGEGWSDFMACVALGKEVVGDWVVGRPRGIRTFRYDEAFPDTYADLGTGRYVDDRVHDLGEIWCATLMCLARRVGAWRAAQVVVDGLKLTAANPSFLAARDAILLAADQYARSQGEDDVARARSVHAVWEVFARFGMGPAARTGPAASLVGIVADFEAPPPPAAVASVRAEAAPRLPIPDGSPVGVTSLLELPDAGPVLDVTVSVGVTHPYRGDLVVVLVAPGGRRVVLHDRRGGRADDLVETWTSEVHPGLAELRGTASGGTWTLGVADRARRDVGVLDRWSIEVAVGPARRTVAAEGVPGLPIPDDDPAGVEHVLVLEAAGTVSALSADVDVTHTYIGDLVVSLVGPDGTSVVLHDRDGGSRDNLVRTYTSDSGGPLAPFVGTPAGGEWRLRAADHAGRDVGKLNRWALSARL